MPRHHGPQPEGVPPFSSRSPATAAWSRQAGRHQALRGWAREHRMSPRCAAVPISADGSSEENSWWKIEITDNTAKRLTRIAEVGLPPSARPVIIRDVAADLRLERPQCDTVPPSDVRFGRLYGAKTPNVPMTPFSLSEIQQSGCAGDTPSIQRNGATLDLPLGEKISNDIKLWKCAAGVGRRQ